MANQKTGVPHALQAAAIELHAQSEKRIEEAEAHGRQSPIRHAYMRCIEIFVDALCEVSGGFEELQMRATHVESKCKDGSEFALARETALKSYRGQPRKRSSSKAALGRLRGQKTAPLDLSTLDGIREDIAHVLDGGSLNLSDVADEAYERWYTICREIQRAGDLLKVDGCRILYQVHKAGNRTPDDYAKTARILLTAFPAAADPTDLAESVGSILAWVGQQDRLGAEGKKKRRKKGRPPADYETEVAEAKVFDAWKRAQEKKVDMITFAADNDMQYRDLKLLVDRVRKRNSRSGK